MASLADPTEAEINYYGEVGAKATFAFATLTFMSTGIQLFMVIYMASVLVETRPEQRKGRMPFIILSLVIYVTSTFNAAVRLFIEFQILFNSMPTGRAYVEESRRWFDSGKAGWAFASELAVVVYILAGDGLMLYRCMVLWRERWWATILPGLVFVFTIVSGICWINPIYEARNTFGGLWAFATVLFNIMATFLIVLRLIRAQRRLARDLGTTGGGLNYSGTIAMVIESAAPLAFFGLCYGVLVAVELSVPQSQRPSMYIAKAVFLTLYYSFGALSPQMLIFRVTTGRSWTTHRSTTSPSQPIAFTVSRRGSGSDKCEDSQTGSVSKL